MQSTFKATVFWNILVFDTWKKSNEKRTRLTKQVKKAGWSPVIRQNLRGKFSSISFYLSMYSESSKETENPRLVKQSILMLTLL